GGRLAARIQVLAPPETREAVAAACFSETATIGLRWTIQNRVLLSRRETVMDGEGGAFRAKIVARPDGKQTAKAEMADLADVGDRAQRERLRRQIEKWALEVRGESDDDA
ncbi:MAG: nickel insertion protein, partial [Alphaproteobacteria bacterium]|nr:nickel insertion protein [Alphaproteobacteria bacterium]